MTIFLLIIGIILGVVVLQVFHGFVLYKLWAWFIVPLGVPGINIWHAFGIAVIVSFLTKNPNAAEKTQETSAAVSNAIVYPLVALGFGYLYHIMM